MKEIFNVFKFAVGVILVGIVATYLARFGAILFITLFQRLGGH